jgi:hypothetical protein
MRLSLFAVLLLVSAPVFAQQGPVSPVKITPNSQVVILTDGNCPVGFSAKPRASAQALWTISLEDAVRPQSPASMRSINTGIHVELRARGTASIREVELTVDYVAPGTHALPVGDSGAPATLKKTFNLAAEGGASLQLAGDLLVGPSAGIKRVHLVSLTYADGSTWQAEANRPCSVEPSHFLLVDHP